MTMSSSGRVELESAPHSPRRSRERLQAAVQLSVDSTDVAFAIIDLTEIGEQYAASSADVGTATDLGTAFGDAVIAADGVVLVEDARNDARFSTLDAVASAPHIRSYVGAPIRGRDGRVVGVFSEYWTRLKPIDAEYRATIEILATWAGREFTAATAENAADRVQQALRPRSIVVPGYEVAGRCVPAHQIGGDFYDWHPVPGGLAITLGDVMGKGVGAGMLAAAVRASLRVSSDAGDPGASVGITDRVVASDFEAAESFATLFHSHLRTEDGRIRFIDAGHGLSIVVPRQGDFVRLESGNLPLGLMNDQVWQRHELVLQPGDTLVSVSDGVLDLYDGTLDSIVAVADIVRSAVTAQEIVDQLSTIALSVAAPDDVTVVALRRSLS
jgi:Stage II sporulation protein E (SpoIIE)/GAF domain